MLTNNQKQILSFFLRYPHHALELICSKFAFSTGYLERNHDRLPWEYISRNLALLRKPGFIEKFQDHLNWYVLSAELSFQWTEEKVDQFKDRLNWSSQNPDEKGKKYFWNMSSIKGFEWSIERIEKYRDYLDWVDFHANFGEFWTEEMIEKYAHAIIWELFYPRSKAPFSNAFIENYIKETEKPWWNFGITDSPELIRKYADDIEWSVASLSDKLPWSKEFIDTWFKRLDKGQFARNSKALHNFEMFDYFRRKWDNDMKYFYLSCCQGKFWTPELVDKYNREWDWNCMSQNTALPWTPEFMDKYRDRLHFGKRPIFVHEGSDMQELHSLGLSNNWAIPWSLALIEKYEKDWDMDVLFQNIAIWDKAFGDCVNEELVDLFFRIY